MPKIKCVGFDLYNTLINMDNQNWNEIIESTFPIIEDLGYSGSWETYFKTWEEIFWGWRAYREKSHIELRSTVWWKEILDRLKIKFEEADLAKIILQSHQTLRTQITLYPEVKKVLSDLKKDYQLACISNISEGDLARADMELFGILHLFDCVVMSSDLGIRKPSPEIFQHTLTLLNIEKNDMIFVGDTLYDDIKGAKEAGLLMAIHIKRDIDYFHADFYIEADRTIHNLLEINDILRKSE